MPRPENQLRLYDHWIIGRCWGKWSEYCLFFRPRKCILLRQTICFLGNCDALANFPAEHFDAAVAAGRPAMVEPANFRRFLNPAGPYPANYLESAVYMSHMN